MFLDLFYGLRDEGVPVAIQEWNMLMDGLQKGLHHSNLLHFYYLSRACLIKSESYYDKFDRVFARVFKGVEGELDITDDVLEWLNDPKNFPELENLSISRDDHRLVLQQETLWINQGQSII